jgi:hypothetical protein
MVGTAVLPRRIILSRKGCDESSGNCPSFIIDREMLSLPIPEDHFVGTRKYSDLKLPLRLRKPDRQTLADLIEAVPSGKRGSLRGDAPVHLDPDIREDAHHETKGQLVDWKPRLGQCCVADAELRDVASGDLFIFFGWYADAEWGDQVTFDRKKTFHAIWGWLQVGEPPRRNVSICSNSRNGYDHPHLAPLLRDSRHRGNHNSIYEASEALTFRPDVSGAGVFCYCQVLRLTHPACRVGCRSLWRLPGFFHQLLKPLPKDAWHKEGGFTCVQTAGRFQEYVFERPADGSLDADVRKWLDLLFERS